VDDDDKQTALEAALDDHSNQSLVGKTEAELFSTPIHVRSRIAYAASLIRITDFLRTAPGGFDEAKSQADTAFKFMKHIEATNLEALKLVKGDVTSVVLRKEMAEMREKIFKLAEAKAQEVLRREHAIDAEVERIAEKTPEANA